MRKITLFLVLIFSLIFTFLFVTTVSAQTPEITNGLAYLTSTQNLDGSWGDDASSTDILPATVSAIETLQILGETDSANYIAAVSWLHGQSIDTTDYISERIRALSGSGTDEDLLFAYLDEITGVWGGYGDYDVDHLDTTLALQALKTVNYPDLDTIGYALSYLLYTQNTDGGWGFVEGDDTSAGSAQGSNTYITALVLKTLSAYSPIFDLQSETASAAAYLLTKQNTDGGFGSSTGSEQGSISTVYETALAFEALIASDADLQSVDDQTINYLLDTQLPNGSWNDDPYSTALAIRALAKVKPNLKVSKEGIFFYSPTLMQGGITTIGSFIRNIGPAAAEDVIIQFYEGDPSTVGRKIGNDILLPTISSYHSGVPVFQEYDTSESIPGRHDIYVLVDPSDAVSELKEDDNKAFKTITIIKQIDLSISSNEIIYSPAQPTPETKFTVMSPVYNFGETTIGNVTVALYEGMPNQGGLKLEEAIIPVIYPMKKEYVSFDLSNQSIGVHSYYIYVDPTGQISESDKSNNIAQIDIEIINPDIEPPDETDLYITNSDIGFNPVFPEVGQEFETNAVVYNSANRSILVDVSLYNGDPANGGIILDTITVTVAQWRSQSVSFTWTMPGEVPVIYIVVDKNNKIAENNETNNVASKVINTYSGDLSITELDISLNPVLPEKGEPTIINVSVNNLGNISLSGTVNVYEVDSEGMRTLFWQSDVFVPGSGTDVVSIDGWVYPLKSGTIAVVVDNVTPGDSDFSSNEAIVTYGEGQKAGGSNEGKEFWIAWPETYSNDAQIIVQSRRTATVTILGPFVSWAGVVSPGSPALIPMIHWGTTEVASNGVIENKGIHITSDEDISVIFKSPIDAGWHDDAYLAIPTKNLGTEYYNISYDPNGT